QLSQGMGQAIQSGDPAQALAALQATSTDVSAVPGRNPVRSELRLPPDVAKSLGLTGPTTGGQTQIEWSALNPAQFTGLLDAYPANPGQFADYIVGSGDVAYLPAAQAQQVADNAKRLTLQYLDALTQPRPTQAAPPEAPPSSEATALQYPATPGGG